MAQQFVLRDLTTGTGLHPATPWFAWVQHWVVNLMFPTGAAMFVFLLFPTGRLLSPRWRLVAWAGIAVGVVAVVLSMLEPQITVLESAADTGSAIDNPVGVQGVVPAAAGPPAQSGSSTASSR